MIIKDILDQLTPRELGVIKARFGIDGKKQTLKEIGESYDVSGNRIRQIETKAMVKLMKYCDDQHTWQQLQSDERYMLRARAVISDLLTEIGERSMRDAK